MEYMSNFLRRKTYRTCAVLISGAAMVMAATVVNENVDNNIAKNDTVSRQALLNHTDAGDSDEDAVPGYLSLDRVYLGAVEEKQMNKTQIEAVVIPQVGTPKAEKAGNLQAEESTEKKADNLQPEENTVQKADNSQTEESTAEKTDNSQAEENAAEKTDSSQPVENITELPENLQEENVTSVNEENDKTGEITAVMGTAVKVSSEEYEALQRIVEAEAGNQDDIGRILVANVVLNRVKSEVYPDTILENIFRHSGDVYQFQPVKNGAYYSVTVSEKTKECVDRALAGEDYSQGALYFTRKTSESSWFNTSLTLLFVHGAHYFYK